MRRFLVLSLVTIATGCVIGIVTLADASQTIEGPTVSRFGYSMTAGYDKNVNDVEVDYAIGAPITGKVYLFDHDTVAADSTVDETQATVFTGAAGGEAGWSLAAGNVISGAWYDLAIGAPSEQAGKGRIYIEEGGKMAANINATGYTILTGENANDYAGWSLATGDINADGRPDLVVGACGYSGYKGRVYVMYGPIAKGNKSLSTANIKITGDQVGGSFGCAVATADINDDGRDEIVTSSYQENFGGAGTLYVIWNPPAGASAITALTTSRIQGDYFGENLGFSLATGDVNGDAYDDILVGAPFRHCALHDVYPRVAGGDDCLLDIPGTAYVVLGGADRRGVHAISSAAMMEAEYDIKYTGNAGEDLVGMAVTFGDFNNDSYDEIVIGSGIHQTYVFQGLSTSGAVKQTLFTNGAIATINGSADARYAGLQLGRLGDVNADGYEDLAVSAPGQLWYEDGAQRVEGELFFFHGGSM